MSCFNVTRPTFLKWPSLFSLLYSNYIQTRGGSSTVATSKMERFVITGNGWKPLNIITKRCILDVGAVLDPLLQTKLPRSYMKAAYRR